jgi:hypothetical protein
MAANDIDRGSMSSSLWNWTGTGNNNVHLYDLRREISRHESQEGSMSILRFCRLHGLCTDLFTLYY